MRELAKKVKIEAINKQLKSNKFSAFKKKNKDIDTSCSICCVDFEQGTTVKQTPCMHIFHNECLFQWIETKINEPDCPFCRAAFKI